MIKQKKLEEMAIDKNKMTVQIEESEGIRADRYISDVLQLFPRSQIKNRNVEIYINGHKSKLSKAVSAGDSLEILYEPEQEIHIEPEEIPLNIIYENSRCIVINKPQGMVVHPAAGNYTGTLVQALLSYIPELKSNFSGDLFRPGIVHRLDKDTSGIIVAAKDPEALGFLTRQFAKKTISKQYLALIKGAPTKPRGTIQHPIARDPQHRKRFTWKRSDGKSAFTEYRLIRSYTKAGFILLSPSTGRTHQLRVHMQSIGHPIIGDPLYGRSGGDFGYYSLMLHAYKLKIRLPGETQPRVFRAHLPPHFRQLLQQLHCR